MNMDYEFFMDELEDILEHMPAHCPDPRHLTEEQRERAISALNELQTVIRCLSKELEIKP